MDIAIQAVRGKTTRATGGKVCISDPFLQDVAEARAVFAGLGSEGRNLTSQEVRRNIKHKGHIPSSPTSVVYRSATTAG